MLPTEWQGLQCVHPPPHPHPDAVPLRWGQSAAPEMVAYIEGAVKQLLPSQCAQLQQVRQPIQCGQLKRQGVHAAGIQVQHWQDQGALVLILVLDICPCIRRFLRRGNRNKLLPQQCVN